MTSNSSDNRIFYSLLQRVGSSGKYQTLTYSIIILFALLGSSSFFVNTYLFYQDPYKCPHSQSNCQQFVCSLPVQQRSNYLSEKTIVTLGNYNGDNHCETMHNITLMQQAILFGASAGLFLGIIFTDILGKRLSIIVSVILSIIGISLIFFDNLKLKCFGLILWGSGAEISFTILYAYIIEIVAQQHRSNYFIGMYIVFAFGTTANAILFYLIKNWTIILIFYYLLLNIIGLIAFILYVQSPPLQIISKSKDPKTAYEAFMKIAAENQKYDHNITLEEIQTLYSNYHNQITNDRHTNFFTFVDICRYPSLRGDFIKLSAVFFTLMFLMYCPALLLDKLFPNIFLNGLINGASQFVTIPVLLFLNGTLSRNKGLTIMFVGSALFSFLQFFMNKSGCLDCTSNLENMLILIFFFIGRFFVNLASNFFANSLNQIFPAQIRGLCVYGVVGVGRFSTLLIPFIPKLQQKYSFSYNIVFGLVGVIGAFLSIITKQTLNIPPPQLIEQLDYNKNQQKEEKRYEIF